MALEKFWVPQCVWIWLCTTVSMGMTITDFCKLFRYGINRGYYDTFIGIREFSELLALYLFNNPFSTYTGAPAKNIPPID